MRNKRKITHKKVITAILLVFFIISSVVPMFLSLNSNVADGIIDNDVNNNELSTSETTHTNSKYNISTWWNSTFKYRIGLEIENTEAFDRYQPVEMYLTFRSGEYYEGTGRLLGCNSSGNHYEGDLEWSTPLPVQVWNESKFAGTDFINNCTITFIANVSANSNKTYFFYYNNNDDNIDINLDYNTGFTSSLYLTEKLTISVDNTEQYHVILEKDKGAASLIKGDIVTGTNLHSDNSLAPEKQLTDSRLKFLAHFDGSNVDSTENSLVVTERGSPIYTADGIVQQCLDVDGTQNVDYENALESVGDPFYDFSNEFTFTCWINPDAITGGATNHQTENVIASKASDPYNDNFEIGVNNEGNIHVYLDCEQDDTYADFGPSGTITTTGGWYFIALRYKDGVVDVRIQDTWYSNTATWAGSTYIDQAVGSPFTIGASDHIDRYFNGQIDEVAVYNEYLSDADIETYKYCSSPSLINSITEIESGQVFSRYQVEWSAAFDMHATDICTFYYDYNLWNINRSIYFDNAFNGSDTLAQMTALNTYYNFSGLSTPENFDFYYDGQSKSGLTDDNFIVENYTIIHDDIHFSTKYTTGIYLNAFRKTDPLCEISYLNGSVKYSNNGVKYTPGSINDFTNNIGGSQYGLEIEFWEFIDSVNISEGYTANQMKQYFNNVSSSLQNPLNIYIYDQDALFFNLEIIVKDHDGNIVPDVLVRLLNQTTQQLIINQTTNSLGATKFYRLNNGSYTVNLTYERYSTKLYSIHDNVDIDMSEATTNTFGEATVTIEDLNLTSFRVNLWRYDGITFKEKVEGANVTFAIDGSVIGYEDTNIDGICDFYWTNSSDADGPNITISAVWHDELCDPITHDWDNDTESNDAYVTFNFFQYQNLTLEFDSTTSYVTRLFVNDSGMDGIKLGDTLSLWINFSQIEIENDIPKPEEAILGGTVSYNIKIGITQINTGTLNFGEQGSGNYSLSINTTNPVEPGGAEWISSTTYTMEIRAYKAGYGTNQTSLTFTLVDKDSTLSLLNGSNPISTYYKSIFTLEVQYNGTIGQVGLNSATITYFVAAVSGLQGDLVYVTGSSGIYRLTLNTTIFLEAGGREFQIQIVASQQNYASQNAFPSVRIYDILTKINGTDSYDIYTADADIFVGDSQIFYFNYSEALSGAAITTATVKYSSTVTNQGTGDKFDFDLTHVGSGIWSVDIETESLNAGKYSLKVRIQEATYEEGIAVVSITIKTREFLTTAGSIYSVVSGNPNGLTISLQLNDSNTGDLINDLTPAQIYITFQEQIYNFTYSNGYYSVTIVNIPDAFFIALTESAVITIMRTNYTTTDISISVAIGMTEIFPGMPMFYFLLIVGAIAAVAGSLLLNRYIQQSKIPTFVKKTKAMRKAIDGNSKISDSLIYPLKVDATAKLLGDRWEAIGLSLDDVLGVQGKKGKKTSEDSIKKKGGDA